MKTNKLLFMCITIITVCSSLTVPIEVFASSVSSTSSISTVSRLNLSRGKISGEKVDYTIYLPSLWSGYLLADREKVKANGGVLEKIVFYYEPQDKKAKPVFLMNFYVYDKRYWKDSIPYNKIVETEDYMFVTECSGEVNFANNTDKVLYARLLKEALNNEYILGFIKLPANQKIILNNTITVNGKMLKDKIVRKENGAVYVPLREVCEKMGYTIGWLSKEKAVTLSKGSFYYLLLTNSTPTGRGYSASLIDNKAYVPSVFFIQTLNANIEIDEHYNVFINN